MGIRLGVRAVKTRASPARMPIKLRSWKILFMEVSPQRRVLRTRVR